MPSVKVEIDTTELEKFVEKIEKLTDIVEKAIALLDKLSDTMTNNKFTFEVKIWLYNRGRL
ncbi:MAG: hypothetical protein ACI4RK_04445 [Oscillospiraceae bacterium]